MKWFKKLAQDFTGTAAPHDNKPVPAAVAAPAPAPVPQAVVTAPAQHVVQRSVEEFEKARDDFFIALKKNDSAAIDRIATDYPGEALQWRNDEGTPLFIAQKNGSLDAFKALVALGVSIEETYEKSDFPLHYAQVNKQKDFFNYLLDAGANIEREFNDRTINHASISGTTHTALGTAIQQGDKDAAIVLMERGASVAAPYTHMRHSISMMAHGSTASATPKTAIEYATEQKHFLIADIAKRAHILRSEYLAREAAAAQPPAPEPVETDSTIGVMQPLRLKKQQDASP